MKYYAEYLSNINFVGVYFEPEATEPYLFATEPRGTTAILSFRDGHSEGLELPAAAGAIKVELAANATNVRVPVSGSLNIPEAASKVPPECRCGVALTGPDVQWKRLPSEHWAELMDLWHCHKPSEPSQAGKSLYDLALNGFHAQVGRAYFSDTYFLVHEADITRSQHLPKCEVAAKVQESGDQSTKLWKWDLDPGPVGRTIAEMFTELIDAHAVYTFDLNNDLLVWVFNPNVVFTATGAGSPARGCKILYGPASQLRKQRPDAETVDLPTDVYNKFIAELAESNARLPSSVQTMGSWRLAII